jgi:hypothetical protein
LQIIKYNLYIILCSGKIMDFFKGILGPIIGPDEETDDDDTDSSEVSTDSSSDEDEEKDDFKVGTLVEYKNVQYNIRNKTKTGTYVLNTIKGKQAFGGRGISKDELTIITGKGKKGRKKRDNGNIKKAPPSQTLHMLKSDDDDDEDEESVSSASEDDSSSEVSVEEEEEEEEEDEDEDEDDEEEEEEEEEEKKKPTYPSESESEEEDEEEEEEEKKSEESKSYEKMKEKCDYYIFPKRGELPEEYNGTEPRIPNRDAHLTMQDEERDKWYKMLKKKKNKFKFNIKLPFKTVDQTGTNACSFLGFSLLCWLKNKDVFESIYEEEKTWENLVEGHWKKEWKKVKENRPTGSHKGGGMNNIGQMLDTVLKTYPFNTKNLVYIPIRGTNDNDYNPKVVDKGTKYPQHLDKIQEYIENIIKTKNYLIMNTDQHTRVYFSYNKTHLLAIDNYPINQKQIRCKNGDTILDETKGGISKVNKFFVYRNVRDLAYFK